MNITSSCRAILLAALLTTVLLPPPARASHETIAVDGNLTDLVSAIGRNSGSSLGGFAIADVQTDVYTDKCPGFLNGYDVRNYYLFLDFKNADGSIATNPVLYAGWDTYGVIGDVDGDGNPSTFSNPQGGCALSDEASIGPIESYRLLLNFCGTRIAQIAVKDVDFDGIPEVQLDGVTIPGATIGLSTNGLEVRIPNLATLLPGVDLANFQVFMTANAENDGLGEDVNDQPIVVDVPPVLTIVKTPTLQGACPDRPVSWTVTVRNAGLSPLQTVTVFDTLQAGLSFTSSTPARTSGDTQLSTWSFGTLAAGATQVITINAQTSATCTGELTNRIGVTGFHDLPAICAIYEETARATAVARVSCSGPICTITDEAGAPPPSQVQVGTRVVLCGPPTAGLTYRWVRPGGAVETGRCLTIASAQIADDGIYTLTVTDPSNCSSTCTFTLDVTTELPCRITGPDTLCVGQPLTLCGPPEPAGTDLSYRWTLPDLTVQITTGPCLTVANPAPGYYSLVVRNVATGAETAPCTHRLQTVKPQGCAIAGPQTVRAGDQVQLCGPIGNFTYLWTLPNGSTRTTRCLFISSASSADNGRYTLVVINSQGCSSDPCFYDLSVGDDICFITGPDQVPAGTPVEYCGPVGTGYTYRWVFPNGTISTDRCIFIPSARVTDSGFYRLTITTPAGTSLSCERKLIVNEPPPCKNCPRSADFWMEECELAPLGVGKFTPTQFDQIVACVDSRSSFFDFTPAPVSGVLIAGRTEWRYHDLGQNLGTTWKDPGTSDATWSVGPGVLGYGESYINTVVSHGPSSSNKYITTYFRKSFAISDVSAFNGLTLHVMYDDGVILYLNGTEVARLSMPAGAVDYLTHAHGHEAENAYQEIDLTPFLGLLHNGTNVLAAEAHQQDGGSSDMVFDAALQASLAPAPVSGFPARQSEWSYHDLGQDLGTAWKETSFTPTGWPSGAGPLGYGESYVNTTVSFGPSSSNKFITTYFRKSFSLSSVVGLTSLTLNLMYDDGAIVYLNGVEVARRNMPSGSVNYLTPASGSHEASNHYETIDLGAHIGLLHTGTNVIAVELHQRSASSDDAVFDAELVGPAPAPGFAFALEGLGGGIAPFGVPMDAFCVLLDHRLDVRSEAKRQFAALLANVCATGLIPQNGQGVCLNLDTEIDCKYIDARTIGALIPWVDARLAALEGRPLSEVEEEYEDLADCLTDINNGWSIPVAKGECEVDDKKCRLTLVGTDVVVPLGPEASVQFAQVVAPGFTSIGVGPGWSVPSELRAVTGYSLDLGTEAASSGIVQVSMTYDSSMIQAPEHTLKLMRYDVSRQVWEDITTSRDPVLNRIYGTCDALSSFVLTEPWSALSTEEPGQRARFELLPGMPNPTSGRTTLRFALSRRGHVKLSIHDIQGRQVATVTDGAREAGNHAIVWNGRRSDGGRLAAGVYLVKLQAGEGSLTSKLVIVN